MEALVNEDPVVQILRIPSMEIRSSLLLEDSPFVSGVLAMISCTSWAFVRDVVTTGALIMSAALMLGDVVQTEFSPSLDKNHDLGLLESPLAVGSRFKSS